MWATLLHGVSGAKCAWEKDKDARYFFSGRLRARVTVVGCFGTRTARADAALSRTATRKGSKIGCSTRPRIPFRVATQTSSWAALGTVR